jgi:hypothetical protein
VPPFSPKWDVISHFRDAGRVRAYTLPACRHGIADAYESVQKVKTISGYALKGFRGTKANPCFAWLTQEPDDEVDPPKT